MNVILELLLRIVRFVIDKISDVIYFILYEESESWAAGAFIYQVQDHAFCVIHFIKFH